MGRPLTGWADPMLVPGAMAMASQARATKAPPEAARATGGGDVGHHGDLGLEDRPLDLLHRGHVPPGRIDQQEDDGRPAGVGRPDGLHHVFGGDGVDGFIQTNSQDFLSLGRRGRQRACQATRRQNNVELIAGGLVTPTFHG